MFHSVNSNYIYLTVTVSLIATHVNERRRFDIINWNESTNSLVKHDVTQGAVARPLAYFNSQEKLIMLTTDETTIPMCG
jgi:hypothetical protein